MPAVQVHHVLVHGGPGGYQDFVSSIRNIFGITTELDMHLAFDCADPVSSGSQYADAMLCLSQITCGPGILIFQTCFMPSSTHV